MASKLGPPSAIFSTALHLAKRAPAQDYKFLPHLLHVVNKHARACCEEACHLMLPLPMLCCVVLMLVLLCSVSSAVMSVSPEYQTRKSPWQTVQTGDRLATNRPSAAAETWRDSVYIMGGADGSQWVSSVLRYVAFAGCEECIFNHGIG